MSGRISPGSARVQARKSMAAANQQFERVEHVLATDLVGQLKQEHEREINFLWEEQLQLREELEKVVILMQDEILPREKQMHAEVERMQTVFDNATKHLHAVLGDHVKGAGLSAGHRKQLEQMADPLGAMEREVDRIESLLNHDVVRPDIQGWQANASSSYRGGNNASARQQGTQYRSQAATRPYTPMSSTSSPTRSPATSRFAAPAPTSSYTAPAPTSSYKAGGLSTYTSSYTARSGGTPTSTFSTGGTSPSKGLFNVIDRNHDGVITRAEFNQAIGSSSRLAGAVRTASPPGSPGAKPPTPRGRVF